MSWVSTVLIHMCVSFTQKSLFVFESVLSLGYVFINLENN